MRRAAVSLVAVSLLGMLAAQERRPTFVIAQDAQGRPLAGAQVTCFASPTLLEARDDVDVVEGVTDERGRFVCRLLTHRVYSAFAIVDGAAGAFLASEVGENVAAGGEIVLRVVIARRPQRVVLEGQAAWQHVGPLRIMMAPPARNLLLIEGKDGRVPRLPDLGFVLVRDAQGQPLWSQGYLAHQPWRPAGDELPQLRDPVVVELPPLRDLRVRVVAPDGAPMPRAELWQWIEQCDPQSYGYCPGALPHDVTDGEGCLQYLMLPLPEARLHFGGVMSGLGGPRPGGIEAGTRTDHVIE